MASVAQTSQVRQRRTEKMVPRISPDTSQEISGKKTIMDSIDTEKSESYEMRPWNDGPANGSQTRTVSASSNRNSHSRLNGSVLDGETRISADEDDDDNEETSLTGKCLVLDSEDILSFVDTRCLILDVDVSLFIYITYLWPVFG